MSATEQQSSRKTTVTTILTLLAGFAIGYFTCKIVGFMSGLAPEYNSASAIRQITVFVEQNRTWPTSWQVLGGEPLDGVEVNWSLDVHTCDRYDVMMSVSPETKRFYTYPHAERQLVELWQTVLKVREQQSGEAVN